MAGSMAVQPIAVGFALQFERGALDVLPTQRTANDGPEIRTRNLIRLEPLEAKLRDPSGRIARKNAQAAQPVAAEPPGVERTKEIAFGELRGPYRRAAATIVVLRRQKRRVLMTRPHL